MPEGAEDQVRVASSQFRPSFCRGDCGPCVLSRGGRARVSDALAILHQTQPDAGPRSSVTQHTLFYEFFTTSGPLMAVVARAQEMFKRSRWAAVFYGVVFALNSLWRFKPNSSSSSNRLHHHRFRQPPSALPPLPALALWPSIHFLWRPASGNKHQPSNHLNEPSWS